MRRVLCLLLAGVGFIAAANDGAAADQKPLTEDEVFQLGVDAYIYGYALLVMDSVRAVSTNVAVTQDRLAPMGQFAHFRSFPDASTRDYAGLNLDTLYSTAWLDLSRGPPDGSMDLYVQKESPEADRRANWLPVPDGEFILMLRLYWPKDEAVNGGWAPPAVRRVGGTQ
jgi:hypothetical protein